MVVPLMPLRVSVSGLSDIGCVRQRNEDVWDQLPEENFFVLADGMGGHRAGDVAAKEAVRALLRIVKQKLESLADAQRTVEEVGRIMRLAIEEVNEIVYDLNKTEEDLRGMGTTICCIHLQPEGLVYAHVGDSRIYRLRRQKLMQLSEDHSLLRELVRLGQVKDMPRADFLYKNIVTKAIGTEPIVEPSVYVTELQHNDVIMMCTDGLSDVLHHDEIEAVLNESTSLRQASEALIQAAKLKGGPDNITVVLAKAQIAP